MRFLLPLLLSGCAPYVGYTHMSLPNIADDGYDLVCAGVEMEKGRYRADVAACENTHTWGEIGTYGRMDVRVMLGKDN